MFRPPDKLVIEVSASGDYAFILWSNNGNTISISSINVETFFAHFTEIYFIEPTTMSDAGIYEVVPRNIVNSGNSDPVQIMVIEFGNYSYKYYSNYHIMPMLF